MKMFPAAAVFSLLLQTHLSFPQGAANELIFLRWIHLISGIIWIGLLYFFDTGRHARPAIARTRHPRKNLFNPDEQSDVLVPLVRARHRAHGLALIVVLLQTDAANAKVQPNLALVRLSGCWSGWPPTH